MLSFDRFSVSYRIFRSKKKLYIVCRPPHLIVFIDSLFEFTLSKRSLRVFIVFCVSSSRCDTKARGSLKNKYSLRLAASMVHEKLITSQIFLILLLLNFIYSTFAVAYFVVDPFHNFCFATFSFFSLCE
jgi:hypothetical protein